MPLLSQRHDGGMRLHFNPDGIPAVKLGAHPSTVVDEVFGRLIKMRNVFACPLLTHISESYLFLIFVFSVGVNMFYICIIVYLYGDLAIYAAAVPISLMEVAW